KNTHSLLHCIVLYCQEKQMRNGQNNNKLQPSKQEFTKLMKRNDKVFAAPCGYSSNSKKASEKTGQTAERVAATVEDTVTIGAKLVAIVPAELFKWANVAVVLARSRKWAERMGQFRVKHGHKEPGVWHLPHSKECNVI